MTRRYTLMEIIVVVAIIALATGLLLPRFGRLPAGLQRRQNESAILDAFRDAGARARAAGVTVQLRLDEDGRNLVLSRRQTAEELEAQPVATGGATGGSDTDVSFLPDMTYPLPNGVRWEPILSGPSRIDEDSSPRFLFHPNGEASGAPVRITIGDDVWRLDVDRLTGRSQLQEER